MRAVTTPRPLGIYAVEWRSSPFADDVFGTLGGVFYGTVMEFRDGRQFFVADAYWLPPEDDPIGPMGLEVTCQVAGPGTRLYVRQGRAARQRTLGSVLRPAGNRLGRIPRRAEALSGTGSGPAAAAARRGAAGLIAPSPATRTCPRTGS